MPYRPALNFVSASRVPIKRTNSRHGVSQKPVVSSSLPLSAYWLHILYPQQWHTRLSLRVLLSASLKAATPADPPEKYQPYNFLQPSIYAQTTPSEHGKELVLAFACRTSTARVCSI